MQNLAKNFAFAIIMSCFDGYAALRLSLLSIAASSLTAPNGFGIRNERTGCHVDYGNAG